MTAAPLRFISRHRWKTVFALVATTALITGWFHQVKPLPTGLNFSGPAQPAWQVQFHGDLTYLDAQNTQQHDQEIFDEILAMIARAERFILVDMFLFNAYTGAGALPYRLLSQELTDALIAKKQQDPSMQIVFITDPVNTVYGGKPEPHLQALSDQGIEVVFTDLTQLRDSNPLYSSFWRPFLAFLGNGPGSALPNPLGKGRVSVRSYLRLLNFKANHRKVLICDGPDGYRALVTSANPHDASSAHDNIALSFSGPAVWDALQAEFAVLRMSGVEPPELGAPAAATSPSRLQLRWVTERAILNAILAQIASLQAGERLDVMMFYLSHRSIVEALIAAHDRGAKIQVLLDPNKDAFGRKKNGIPNRQVAYRFQRAGITVRWADTHGEQCHSKMLLFQQAHRHTLILGSANLTRRNLDNYNLEANVVLAGAASEAVFSDAKAYFDQAWGNLGQRRKSVGYATYADPSLKNRLLYWVMESMGLSTF